MKSNKLEKKYKNIEKELKRISLEIANLDSKVNEAIRNSVRKEVG